MTARRPSALVVALSLLVACSDRAGPGDRAPEDAADEPSRIRFREVLADSGIDFVDTHGRVGMAKEHLAESMGGGAGLIDYDADGDLDLFLAGGDPWEGGALGEAAPGRLYRNDGGFRFVDVTATARVGVRREATAVAVGDVDADGFDDLFVAAHGPNVLFTNAGDGTFADVSRAAGVDDDRYATAAAFGDFDGDADLDLFVGNYYVWDAAAVALSAEGGSFRGHAVMAGPRGFIGEADVLYANRGEGGSLRFEDVTVAAGLGGSRSFALGAVTVDVDEDGDLDLYVANDSEANSLFVNDGAMRFEDRAVLVGVALDAMGRAQAGMGVTARDLDGDGAVDLFMTNFSHDTNTVYRNLGGGYFEDATRRCGLANTSYLPLGFGCVAFDPDLDGDLDLAIANGHVFPVMDEYDMSSPYAQPNQIFENVDGRFREDEAALAPAAAVSRGMVRGDLDGDGREDLVITDLNGPPSVLRNESDAGGVVVVRLVGARSNRNAIGARVNAELESGRRLERHVVGGASYMSASTYDVFLGLGEEGALKSLTVTWPDGAEQAVAPPAAGSRIVVVEGEAAPRVEALTPRR